MKELILRVNKLIVVQLIGWGVVVFWASKLMGV